MTKLFVAAQFTATHWETAEDKAQFANHFVRFVQSGYKRTLFTKVFYTRLSNSFGHIACCNLLGFYETFFTSLPGLVRFAEITLQGGGYGDPRFTYSDVERALKSWALQYGLLEKAHGALSLATEAFERKELVRLQLKYGQAAA